MSDRQYNFDYYKFPIELATYTNVQYIRGKLFVRGIDNQGARRTFYCDWTPTVWVPLEFSYKNYSNDIEQTSVNEYSDFITGAPLVQLKFKSIYGCNQFVRENTKTSKNQFGKFVRETSVHTSPSNMFVSDYISHAFAHDCHVASDKLRILTFDIETEVGHRADGTDDSIVTIRNKTTQETKQVTIQTFEDLYNDHNWELFDQSMNTWVEYTKHPYQFIGNFPDPLDASEKVTLITVKDINSNKIDTWGYYDFNNERKDVTYHKCNDEVELLSSFVEFIANDYPDGLVSWNGSVFDCTYLAVRIKNVLGEQYANRLSPCQQINFKQVDHNEYGQTITETTWVGIADLDYLKLYKKFTPGKRESYKLDSVAEDEIGIKKVPNPTGGSFKDFYSGKFDVQMKPDEQDDIIKKLGYARTVLRKKIRASNYNSQLIEQFNKLDRKIVDLCTQRFIEYNIRDVELVDQIDKKRKYIDLLMTIAYLAHCNFENVFSPVQTWDYMIYNELLKRKQVIPVKHGGEKSEKFPGAYVKEPLVGKHEYCISFDLDSLYPHILMQYNISPESIVRTPDHKPVVYPIDLDSLVNKTQNMDFAKQHDYSVAASGVCFIRNKWGLVPQLCSQMYADRKVIKRNSLTYENEHEKIVEELRRRGIEIGH